MWFHVETGLDKTIPNPTDAGPFSPRPWPSPSHIESSGPDAFSATWVTEMLINPGRPINSTRTAARGAVPCCPLLCTEEASFPQVEQIVSQLQYMHTIFTEEKRMGGDPGRSSPLWSGSLQLPALRRLHPSTSQHSGLTVCSGHPAPTLVTW